MTSTHSRSSSIDQLRHEGVRWQLQRSGQGPTLLLLHGTGGSAHCWSDARMALANDFHVITVDLPGHGDSVVDADADRQALFTLPGMAHAIGGLLHRIGERPAIVAGHSAGVAILMRLVLDGAIMPSSIVGFAPALIAPPMWLTALVSPLAAALVDQDVVATQAARLSRHTTLIERLLDSTGSVLTRAQMVTYASLFAQSSHTRCTLAMMARWNIPALQREWHALTTPVRLVAARGDRWIPLNALMRAAAGIPGVTWQVEEGGHLMPEERPDIVIRAVREAFQEAVRRAG